MKRSEMQSAEPSGWLPDDVARCAGVGSDAEGWREGCDTCLRRLSPGGRVHMQPPPIIAFWCEFHVPANPAVTGPQGTADGVVLPPDSENQSERE